MRCGAGGVTTSIHSIAVLSLVEKTAPREETDRRHAQAQSSNTDNRLLHSFDSGAIGDVGLRLAALYSVEAKVLLQAVRRNQKRFPPDFIFKLNNQEVANLRSQIVTSSLARGYGGRRYTPWAFTEQGVAMLSSILRSDIAVNVNIEIMRAFVRLRRAALASAQLLPLIEDSVEAS